MDKTSVWCGYGAVSECYDVRLIEITNLCSIITLFSLITLFLYMVAELSALQSIINALTGLNGLPPVVVQCVVTTIYTCKSKLPQS